MKSVTTGVKAKKVLVGAVASGALLAGAGAGAGIAAAAPGYPPVQQPGHHQPAPPRQQQPQPHRQAPRPHHHQQSLLGSVVDHIWTPIFS